MASIRIDEDAPVLIAESSPVYLSVLKEHLADFRLQRITFAKDGYELLSLTQETHYELIIIGDTLAKASSLQSISQIRTEGKNQKTPLIFLYDEGMKASEKKGLIEDAIAKGASATLGKPIEKHTLRTTIENILEKIIVTSDEMKSRSKKSLVTTEKAIELANRLRDEGDFENAEALYVEAILNVFYGLSEMHLFKGDKNGCDHVLREASFIDLRAPEKFLKRTENFIEQGYINLKKKNYQLAKFNFEAAITMDNDVLMAQIGIGEALLGLGNKDETIKVFEQVLDFESDTKNGTVYKRLGTVAFRIKEYDIAVRAFEIALSCIQSDPEIFYHQSLVLVAQWKFEEALQSVTKALKLQPNFPEAKKARGKIMGWIEAAEQKMPL